MSPLALIRTKITERLHDPMSSVTVKEVQDWSDLAGVSLHIAVMVEPYLGKIKRGEKYIESRLTKVNIAPFNRAAVGDVILFKRSGGAIVAIAEVGQVLFEVLDGGSTLNDLVAEYADGLCYESSYAASKAEARYASLLWLRSVEHVSALAMSKRGRQAWLTFEPAGSNPDLQLF